jgi:hypothetical protein
MIHGILDDCCMTKILLSRNLSHYDMPHYTRYMPICSRELSTKLIFLLLENRWLHPTTPMHDAQPFINLQSNFESSFRSRVLWSHRFDQDDCTSVSSYNLYYASNHPYSCHSTVSYHTPYGKEYSRRERPPNIYSLETEEMRGGRAKRMYDGNL